MRDPHVETMHYKVGSVEGISYQDPEPVSFSNHLGEFSLADNKLRITPAEHFAEEDEARGAIESYLRAWEISTDLNSNFGMIRFEFERVELIDRDPPPPGSSHVISVKAASMVLMGSNVTLHLTCRRYPNPPTMFSATPDVLYAYRRWLRFRAGNEPLQSMAYFVLTLLESTAGGRQIAAQSFQIEPDVLGTMGRLSSTKGDESTARKVGRSKQFLDLSPAEKQWLEEAVRCVIRRLGEHASGAQLTPIKLSDLPRI